MPIVDKVTFIAAIEAAAIDINAAWVDDGTPLNMDAALKDPRHPLRALDKLFKFDTSAISTGQIIVNEAYIDQAYDVPAKLQPAAPYGAKLDTIIPA